MIKIGNISVTGWEAAIRGMRNPMDSWEKSDSAACLCDVNGLARCVMADHGNEPAVGCSDEEPWFCIGERDYKLMSKLAKAGPEHRKFMRMVNATMDITAPLYWWKEFDTYKVGTVCNSCSTMHTLHKRPITIGDFSIEHLDDVDRIVFEGYVRSIEVVREYYEEHGTKSHWYSMVQMLPSSYNQRRTVQLSYESLANIYRQRKGHKLDEWRDFCVMVEGLPYGSLLIGGADD